MAPRQDALFGLGSDDVPATNGAAEPSPTKKKTKKTKKNENTKSKKKKAKKKSKK